MTAKTSPRKSSWRAAVSRFKRFQGREPKGAEISRVRFPKSDVDALQVGKLVGLIYIAAGDGKQYIHKFKTRPLLYVSSDGKQAFMLKGAFTLTERGFVG